MRKCGVRFKKTIAQLCAALVITSSLSVPNMSYAASARIIKNLESQSGLDILIQGDAGIYEIYLSTDSQTWMYVGETEIHGGSSESVFHDMDASDFDFRLYKLKKISGTKTSFSSPIPVVGIQAARSQAQERGENPAILFVNRNGDYTGELTVGLNSQGTADPQTDFASVPSQITIPSGQNNVKVYLYPHDDLDFEGEEYLDVSIEDRGYYSLSDASKARVRLIDNDSADFQTGHDKENENDDNGSSPLKRTNRTTDSQSQVDIQISHNQISEGSSEMVTVVITRQGGSSGELPVNLNVAGSAVQGQHIGRIPSKLRFSKNNNVLTIPVFVIDDTSFQENRTLVIQLESGSGYLVSNSTGVKLDILENDSEPQSTLLAVNSGQDLTGNAG